MLIYLPAFLILLLIAQAMSDRLIAAERALECTKNIVGHKRAKGPPIQEALDRVCLLEGFGISSKG